MRFLQRIIAFFGKSEFYDKTHKIYVCKASQFAYVATGWRASLLVRNACE